MSEEEFETLEARVSSRRSTHPVHVTSRKGAKSQRAHVYLSIAKGFAGEHAIAAGATFDVQVGKGSKQGFMRLKKRARAPFIARRMKAGAIIIDLGFVDQFPNHAFSRQGCPADWLDATTIEIVLPDWRNVEDTSLVQNFPKAPAASPAKPGGPMLPAPSSSLASRLSAQRKT